MRKALCLVAAAAFVLVGATPASAVVAAAGPGSYLAGFLTPVVVAVPGEGITFTNADIAPHDLVAYETYMTKKQAKKAPWCSGFSRGKCPLFWSQTINAGQSTEVLGLENVQSGETYTFYCSRHPGMKGTLIAI